MLDFRHVDLSTIQTFRTRAEAQRRARTIGWPVADIYAAYTRFCRFWVLGQWVAYGQTLRIWNGPAQTQVITCGAGTVRHP